MKKPLKMNKTEAIYIMIILVIFINYSDPNFNVFIICSIEKSFQKNYPFFGQRNINK